MALAGCLALMLACGTSVFAQEHSYGKEEPVYHDVSPDVHAPEGDPLKFHQQDTLHTFKALPPKPKSKPGDMKHQEDEEALKFNFLYFIIQKFKISDIID